MDAKALLVHLSVYETIAPEFDFLKKLEHVLVYGGPVPDGAKSYEDAWAAADPSDPKVVLAPGDLHVIGFRRVPPDVRRALCTACSAGVTTMTSCAG